jgi:hypothetical protein
MAGVIDDRDSRNKEVKSPHSVSSRTDTGVRLFRRTDIWPVRDRRFGPGKVGHMAEFCPSSRMSLAEDDPQWSWGQREVVFTRINELLPVLALGKADVEVEHHLSNDRAYLVVC